MNPSHHPSKSTPAAPRKQRGHTMPRAPLIGLDQPGRLRVAHVLAILGIAASTLYDGIKSGRYPAPDARDGSFPWWRTSTIKAFLAGDANTIREDTSSAQSAQVAGEAD